MKVLVAGGCGFIGSNFIHFVLKNRPDWEIVNADKLTYAGNVENVKDILNHAKHRFVRADICDRAAMEPLFAEKPDLVVNFAAQTHVDRSIHWPDEFVRSNIYGAFTLLELSKNAHVGRFVQISTDEVYGSAQSGSFREDDRLNPSSVYSASKAGADILALSYVKTYGLDAVITRSSNNYGPCQHPEKFIPLFVTNALDDKECPVYGDGMQVRDWLFVDDNCEGILAAAEKGSPGEIYNIGAGSEHPNIKVAKRILELLGKPDSLLKYVKDRPAHDRRYSLDISKARERLGWSPRTQFDAGLKLTVQWYRDNRGWISKMKDPNFWDYYQKHYSILEKS